MAVGENYAIHGPLAFSGQGRARKNEICVQHSSVLKKHSSNITCIWTGIRPPIQTFYWSF